MNEIHGQPLRTSIKKKSHCFRIIVGVVLFSPLTIFVAFSLAYFFIDAKTAGKYLTALIETRIDKKIKYSDLSICWLTFLNVHFSLKELNVIQPHSDEPAFQAKEIDCDLDIGALFFRSLKVKRLSVVNPTLFLHTEQTNNESFQNYETNLLEEFWLKPEITQFELRQGSVVNLNKPNSFHSSPNGQLIFSQLDIKFQKFRCFGS